jgi:hypothetical protein
MHTVGDAATVATQTRVSGSVIRPNWRRQPHTWFLLGLIAANVAFDSFAFVAFNDWGAPSYILGGILPAQLFLLGLWMALGGLHAAARLVVVATMTIAGTTAFWLGLDREIREVGDLLLYSGMLVLSTHALLLPLRTLVGWRVDFDPAYHTHSSNKSLQLRVVHLIAFTAACALPFAFMRAAEDRDAVLRVFVFGGIGLAASSPLAWIVLAARRSLRFWIPALGMLLMALVVVLGACGNIFNPIGAVISLICSGSLATVLVNLGVLRFFFGLRLFSIFVGPPASAVASGAAARIECQSVTAAGPG